MQPASVGVANRLKKRFPRITATYFTFDRRSLGLTRIYLGCLLLYDVVRRIPGLPTWYTNDGLLPNHTHLWRPAAPQMFSFFFAASWPGEAAVLFVFCGIAFFCLLVGYKTKVAHILSFASIVSLHSRGVFLENGGDVVLNLLCFWTLFLPMGDRFSVDAMLASLRQRRERNIDELNDRTTLLRDVAPVRSLVVLAILLELSVIYYFNALSKTGFTWRRGSAVHYVLYQERMVTWFGYLIRDHVNFAMSRFMTFATLFLEATAPILVLSPVSRMFTRRAAILLLPGMHMAFAALLNVGMFSFNMMGFFPLLLSAADWDLLRRRLGPGLARARTVYFDDRSGICAAWARVLVRLDVLGLLRFASIHDDGGAARGAYEVEQAITGHRASGVDAFADSLAALPAGLPLALVVRTPGVRGSLRFLLARLAKRREQLSRWFGLVPLDALEQDVSTGPSRARRWFWARCVWLREAAVVVVMIAITSQILMENKIVPKVLKRGQAPWMIDMVVYPRLFQGWSMFTPDAPTGERMLYIDALTFDGRHVDPFNQEASRVSPLPLERIPGYMDQNEFWCDYTNRIPDNSVNWGPLKDWIFKYSTRTGRPEDRIISYEARILESDSPPPGQTGARNVRTRVMAREHE
jgi:predicted DCC family thiol-disulfide oxidoreductase YuxK